MWEEWKEQHYQACYERVLSYLEARWEAMGEAFLPELEQTLDGLYVRMGNDQEGRALPAELELEATIAAYEAIVDRAKQS
ncbi:MAG: hypothetical protein RBU37_28280 [Myxococcota bacterium]|jgi:hypothetical protein|nr:hypothetical protein [Myxococcota bacterium]